MDYEKKLRRSSGVVVGILLIIFTVNVRLFVRNLEDIKGFSGRFVRNGFSCAIITNILHTYRTSKQF